MATLLGIDPGLRFTGWGVIEVDGNRFLAATSCECPTSFLTLPAAPSCNRANRSPQPIGSPEVSQSLVVRVPWGRAQAVQETIRVQRTSRRFSQIVSVARDFGARRYLVRSANLSTNVPSSCSTTLSRESVPDRNADRITNPIERQRLSSLLFSSRCRKSNRAEGLPTC